MQGLFPLQRVKAFGKRTALNLEAPSSVEENFISRPPAQSVWKHLEYLT